MRAPKIACVALGLIVVGLVLPGRGFADDKTIVDRATWQKNVDQLLKDLDDLADKNEDNANKDDRKKVRDRIETMRRELGAMRQEIDAAPAVTINGAPTPAIVPPTPTMAAPIATPTAAAVTPAPTLTPVADAGTPPTPIPTPAGPAAIGVPDLQTLSDMIAKTTYSGDKITILRDAAKGNWFSVDQVVSLLALYKYSNDKVTAAAMLYPRVVDKNDWPKVYDALTYKSDRAKLQSLTTGGKPPSPP